MRKLLCKIIFLAVVLIFSSSISTFAGPVLVTENSWIAWGADQKVNMNAVFGSGNYTVNSFATDAGSIFNSSNNFVWLEGGADTDGSWSNFINSNSSAILGWVNNGGRLLLRSAGWSNLTTTLGPGTIQYGYSNNYGTLTANGSSSFIFQSTPTTQSGSALSHDRVTGSGLTVFMTGDDTGDAIIAGIAYGEGYIMYAGLTDSYFHASGPSLMNDVIAYTAGISAVPLPAALYLFAPAFAALAAIRRRFNK